MKAAVHLYDEIARLFFFFFFFKTEPPEVFARCKPAPCAT